MSIAAGILLQAVASTGAVQAEPEADPAAVEASTDVAADPAGEPEDDASVDDMDSAVPTVDVGVDQSATASIPKGAPADEDEPESNSAQRRKRLTARGGGAQPGGDWEFDFHGYFRAPMRIGVGPRVQIEDQNNPGTTGQSPNSVHYPVVPDDQYLSYQYTLHNPRDWAELYFSYGNGIAKGTVSIQGFNFTDAAWVENDMQFGVAQAFVTLTPEFKAKWFDLIWKIGSFDNRYGEAGRYDAGEFETYLFGRTHSTGEAGRIQFTIKKKHKIGIEHGFGVNRPNPSELNGHRFTLMHHWHLDYTFRDKIELGVHYLSAFAREADRIVDDADAYVGTGAPDGVMHVVGPDFRFDWGRIGYYYVGMSYIRLDNAGVVGPAIEVLHSKGGGLTEAVPPGTFANPLTGTTPGPFAFGLVDNYLQGPYRNSRGTGSIITVMAQADHSVQRIMKGDKWDGESWDVAFKLYMMYNQIASDDADNDGSYRLKYGVDVLGTALKWLGVGVRFTRVQPHSKVPEQSFAILSPRLVFKTNWIARESIELQYSRYFYNSRVCPGGNNINPATGVATPPDTNLGALQQIQCVQPPPFPAGPEGYGAVDVRNEMLRGQPKVPPDENVFMVKATFWW